MTINHPIRRVLARVCSCATMARVVDPILADVRWERGSSWLACLALARALALHGLLSMPGVLSRAWYDDGFAIPRMALWTVIASIVFTVPIIAPTLPSAHGWPALLLVPQGVAWTLPAVLLLAVPIALGGQAPSGRLTRRTIALATVCVAVTFAMILWIAPAASESYRQIVEKGIQVDGVRGEFPNWSAAPTSRLVDYQYHQRLAFGTAALPLALYGLALSAIPFARRRPWLFGIVAASAYMFVAFPLELWMSAELLRESPVPPFALAWAPNLVILIAALDRLARGTVHQTSGPAAAR